MILENFYVIKEKATGFIMVLSEDLQEIKKIYKNYNKKYYILENNKGEKIK